MSQQAGVVTLKPQLDVITIGATNLQRTRRFYEEGLGCPVEQQGDGFVTLGLGPNSSRLELCPWEALADEAGVSPQSEGFRGFTLSYIVDRASRVDDVLDRVTRAGGTISSTKPPKNGLWGYSGYVTDPSGHLWKIASSKRRPFFRKRAADDGKSGKPHEIALLIGVADIKRSKQFYEEGLGWSVKKSYPKFVSFDGGEDTSDFGMYTWDALAGDAGVPPAGSGFRGFSLSRVLDSAEDVDRLLELAVGAGGKIATSAVIPTATHTGYFTDLDGYLWKVQARA